MVSTRGVTAARVVTGTGGGSGTAAAGNDNGGGDCMPP